MKIYKRLGIIERHFIQQKLQLKWSFRRIAGVLGCSPNTISYEVKKINVYDAKKAQERTYQRRYYSKRECLKIGLDPYLKRRVKELLEKRCSPERISGRLRREGYIVSHKAIYKYIYARSFERYLHKSWCRRKRGVKAQKWPMRDPEKRYVSVANRITHEPGHYEGDFIVSSHNETVLFVATDRYTNHSLLALLPNRKEITMNRNLPLLFKNINLKTLTLDNDIAFRKWKTLEHLLHTMIYFTKPYAWFEKALVENTNKWIRGWLPKRTNLAFVSDEKIKQIDDYLNCLPRQKLNYRSSFEVAMECGLIRRKVS